MTTVNGQWPKAPGVRQENNQTAPGKSSVVGGEMNRSQLGTRVPGQRPAPKVGVVRDSK
jgi:hypothetical protein